MEFSRQEYWSGLPFPFPGDLSDPGIKPGSPALQADSLPLSHWVSPLSPVIQLYIKEYSPDCVCVCVLIETSISHYVLQNFIKGHQNKSSWDFKGQPLFYKIKSVTCKITIFIDFSIARNNLYIKKCNWNMTVSELKNTKLKSNWISIPVFSLASCVILGQLLYLSGPHFLCCTR